jgi:hypothetical protein
MTKKEYIKNSMFYTGEKNVTDCIDSLSKTLRDVTKNTITFDKSVFIEPSAGNGSFSKALYKSYKDISVFSIDTHPGFDGCREGNFLEVKGLNDTGFDYTIFLGFPPVREYEEFVKHSIGLGADVIAFIMPISSINKKNLKVYKDNNYSVVSNIRVKTSDFTLPDGSTWDFSGNFVIIIKNDHIKKDIEKNETESKKSYRDFFDVYTINTNTLTIKETTQPNLFKNGRVPKNRKTGKPYEILTDEKGNKYYYQNGINIDKIEECELFLPLRVFPSKEEGMILYESFDDKTFANIGFGLKIKDGYTVKKVKGKIIYYLYREKFRGIYTLVAKLDDQAVRNFYARKRYNNGVYVSSKKLIEANKKGIL